MNLKGYAKSSEIINDAIKYASEKYCYDGLFGYQHALFVTQRALNIIPFINKEVDIDTILLGCLFHDIGIKLKNGIPINLSTHTLRGIKQIKEFFERNDLRKKYFHKVKLIILKHYTKNWKIYGKPSTLEEKIVYDADKSVWISLPGIIKASLILKEEFPNCENEIEGVLSILKHRYNSLRINVVKQLIRKNYKYIYKMINNHEIR